MQLMSDKEAEEARNKIAVEVNRQERAAKIQLEENTQGPVLASLESDIAALEREWKRVKRALERKGGGSALLVLDLKECIEKHQLIREQGLGMLALAPALSVGGQTDTKERVQQATAAMRTRLKQVHISYHMYILYYTLRIHFILHMACWILHA